MTFGCNTVSLPLRITAKLGFNELLGDRTNVFVKTGLIFCSNWPIDIEKFVRFVEPRIGGFKSGFLELRVVTLLRVDKCQKRPGRPPILYSYPSHPLWPFTVKIWFFSTGWHCPKWRWWSFQRRCQRKNGGRQAFKSGQGKSKESPKKACQEGWLM